MKKTFQCPNCKSDKRLSEFVERPEPNEKQELIDLIYNKQKIRIDACSQCGTVYVVEAIV